MSNPYSSASHRICIAKRSQQGVILVVTLIALVVMLVGAAALIRSFNTSFLTAGQLAFKQDLMNRGEIGLAQARKALLAGALASEVSRQTNNTSANYFASMRANNDNAQGVPKDLIKDSDFTGQATDITADGVTIRYIIERQCTATGAFDIATCSVFSRPASSSGGERNELVEPEYGPIYRITVRVKGPRNTTAYLQSLVSI